MQELYRCGAGYAMALEAEAAAYAQAVYYAEVAPAVKSTFAK
jgi:hypothetical protein